MIVDFMNRDIICSRVMNSDERGYFFSIPIGEFYHYIDEKNKIEMIICGLGMDESTIFFNCVYDNSVKNFLSANGIYTSNLTLYAVDGKRRKYALNIRYNPIFHCIDFFDAFFDLQYTTHEKILPFIFLRLEGNTKESLDEINLRMKRLLNNENYQVELVIDDYTNKVTGIIYDNDVFFNPRGVIFDKKELLKITNSKTILSILEQPYYYKNNILFLQTELDNETAYFDKVKKNIGLIRHIYSLINSNSSKEEIEQFQVLIKQVQECQKEIELTKKDKYIKLIEEKNKPENYKYYSSVCLLIKDENEYLEEWLDNYYNLGVDHCYIYDNGSKTPIKKTIEQIQNGKYINYCTVINFTGDFKNLVYECYNHCLNNYGPETFWLAFIDTDELLTLKENQTIKDFLKPFENKGFMVWVPWKIYNANGHVNKVKGLQKERFTNTVIDEIYGCLGKIFVQPFRTAKTYTHCAFGRKVGIDISYTTTGEIIGSKENNKIKKEYMNMTIEEANNIVFSNGYLAHYATRSFEEWCIKLNRGSCDPNARKKLDEFFIYNQDMLDLRKQIDINNIIAFQPYEPNLKN